MKAGYLIKEGFKNTWSNRMMTIASVGVLVSCLLLTGAATLICWNVQQVVDSVGDQNIVNVYLNDDVTEEQAAEIGNQIKAVGNIASCDFYSKDVAISEFKDVLGDVYDNMQGEDNPLPNAYHISLTDLSAYDQTVQSVGEIDGVSKVSNRSDVADKLTSLSNLVATMGFWIILALIVISLFIISNTIRMSMYSRRFEISIMKSVGATDGFVRTPFVVEGMLMGMISGVLSSVILVFLYDTIIGVAQNIIPFSAVSYNVFALPVSLGFIAIGVLVGAVGGFISIGKYLKKEGNEILGW